jgi:hypothetical protein
VPPQAPPARAAAASSSAVVDDRTPEEIEIARMMRSKVSIAAADTMVKVAGLGVRAKVALGAALTKALQRSRQSREAVVPRRKTSPPPGGALHASGKRVVREGAEGQEAPREEDDKRAKTSRKAMVAAGGASGLVVISVIVMLSRGSSAPPGADAAEAAPAAAPAPTAQPAAEGPVNPNGAIEAKVPLFGPTMVATPEAATPAAPASLSTPAMSPINRTPAFGGAATFGAEPVSRVAGADQKGDADDAKSKTRGKVTPFGHGKVEHAMVLRIKTDGTISDMHGVRSAGGFTLSMPGRRTLDSGTALAARDPRIASVKVANNAKGSELTFQFKGGVPAYLVSPSGRELQLSLGRPDAAHAAKDAAHRGATAQKRATEAVHRPAKR